MTTLFHWLFHFREQPEYRIWSGTTDLVFEGETYLGLGSVMNIGPIELNEGAPDTRTAISLNLGTVQAPERAVFFQDPGPIKIELNFIFSKDNGETYHRLPRRFLGRLSRPRFHHGIYTTDIEVTNGDIDRGVVTYWSDGSQRLKYPGDIGLEYKKAISDGFDITFPYGRTIPTPLEAN